MLWDEVTAEVLFRNASPVAHVESEGEVERS